MVKRAIALLVTVTLTASACATATPRLQTAAAPATRGPDRALIADFVQKLPIGSRVRVYLTDGTRERGTLMDATADRVVVQPRTRIPEAPREIPLDRVLGVDVENSNGGSVGRAIGIGIAAGAGAFVAVWMILVALYAGD